MAVLDCKSVSTQIRKGALANVYYFYGADLVQVEALTRQLIQAATGGNETFALTKYEVKNFDLRALSDTAEMFPMMAPYNCIWVHDVNADSLREEQLKQLLELCANIGSQTVLLFSVTGFDVKGGKKTASGKNKKLIDCIAKHGIVCEAEQRTFAELAKALIGGAQRRGCMLERSVADEMVVRCMGNTVRLQSELDKLCAHAGGGTIAMEDVRALVAPSIETTTFALAKAVISLKPSAAMAELDRLFAMRTERTFIVHAVASAFLDLYRASVAWRSGHTAEEMRNDFSYRMDFVVRNAFRDCRKIQPERLRACVGVLCELEEKLNSSAADERVLLETAIVKMLEIASGRMEVLQ